MKNMNEEDILKRLNSTVGLGRGTLLKLQGKFESYTNLKNAIEEDPSCLLNIDTIGNTIAERIIDAVLKDEENKTCNQIIIEDAGNQEENDEQLEDYMEKSTTDDNLDQVSSAEEFFDHIEKLLAGFIPKKPISDVGLSYEDLAVDYDIYYNDDFILISVKLLLEKIFNGNTYNLDKTLDCMSDSIIYKNKVKKGNSISRYSFSTYSNITGNSKKYIKIFIEPLEMFLNKRIFINHPLDEIDVNKCIFPDFSKVLQKKKDDKHTIMIDFCKKLMEDSKYICSFSCFIKEYENNDKMEFKSVIKNIGTYIFDINDIDHGQWLFDDKYKETTTLDKTKDVVLSLLHEHKEESDGIC